MIGNKRMISKLKDLGLNSYEIKIWIALLSRGVSTAGELSEIANVPRSRSYDVLESLEHKGFVIMKIGKPIKYMAVPPEEAIERVKAKIKQDAEEKSKIIDKLKDDEVIKELDVLFNKGVDIIDPHDKAASLRTKNNIYNHLMMLIKGAQDRIDIMTTEQGLKEKSFKIGRYLQKAAGRGVNIRIAVPYTEGYEDYYEYFSQFAKIKYINDIKAKFTIVDDKEIIFSLLDDTKSPEFDVGLWMNTSFLGGALRKMFDVVWNTQHSIVREKIKTIVGINKIF